ncbi:unnamed protein product, partial [Ixodes pacificus]
DTLRPDRDVSAAGRLFATIVLRSCCLLLETDALSGGHPGTLRLPATINDDALEKVFRGKVAACITLAKVVLVPQHPSLLGCSIDSLARSANLLVVTFEWQK